jgi:hypothetical protein
MLLPPVTLWFHAHNRAHGAIGWLLGPDFGNKGP